MADSQRAHPFKPSHVATMPILIHSRPVCTQKNAVMGAV
jgi:hypothetical protein